MPSFPPSETKGIPTTYGKAPAGTHCLRCQKRITEGAAIRSGVVRVRCRHCKALNVITEVNQYIIIEE